MLMLETLVGFFLIFAAGAVWYGGGRWVERRQRLKSGDTAIFEMARVQFCRDLLDPAMEPRFTTISQEVWSWAQTQARRTLFDAGVAGKEIPQPLSQHLQSIVNGVVPFGLKVDGDKQ